MDHITKSENETAELAQKIADHLRPELSSRPMTIFLTGTLGAGKSVFARHMIRALLDDKSLNVPSPTFTLVQSYDSADGFPVHHMDLYRLKDPDEIIELGWDDMQAEGLCLIEWPERLGSFKPRKYTDIAIETDGGDGPRHISITGEAEEFLEL